MASSLDKLTQGLTTDQKVYTMKYLKEKFPLLSKAELESLLKKGIFPYSYFDSVEKLDEIEFPAYEAFVNDLTGENVAEKAYLDAKELYHRLGFKSFREWLLLY